MLGWEIFIRRGAQADPFALPGPGDVLARWTAGLGATEWLEGLVTRGLAVNLGGSGYPLRYALACGTLLAVWGKEPLASVGLVSSADDGSPPNNRAMPALLDIALLHDASPFEMLIVEAWDQS
jgi:hypothetical protein